MTIAHVCGTPTLCELRGLSVSWGEIGRALGVPKQLLHRRFRNERNEVD